MSRLVKNAVNLDICTSAANDDELIANLEQIVTDFHIYGVRSFVSSGLGIIEVERRDVTPEQYRQEVHDMAEAIRAERNKQGAK